LASGLGLVFEFRFQVYVLGFRSCNKDLTLIQASALSLSLDESKESDSPNGKITPAVLFPVMPNKHFLVKFWKCQKAVSILPHEAKALLELFCLQTIIFG